MNTKNFLVSSLVGAVVYWLLGWLFYGILFTDIYPPSDNQNMVYIFLGCLSFAVLMGYIFNQWAGISTLMGGLYAGATIGLLYGLSMNFFMYSNMEPNMTNMLTDVVLNAVMAAVTGAVMGIVIGKMK